MKKSNIATELEMKIAAALAATAGSDTAKRLKHVRKALKAQRAPMTDERYARKACELQRILDSIDGLIGEASPRAWSAAA
jgi:hypothetical protein